MGVESRSRLFGKLNTAVRDGQSMWNDGLIANIRSVAACSLGEPYYSSKDGPFLPLAGT